MPKLIFEDAEDSPVSSLIKGYYKEYNWRDYVIFAGGKDNLFNKLQENYLPDEYYIIFVDLLPDNYDVIKSCRRLLKCINKSGYKNVIVIPVICAEYYVLNAFKDYCISNKLSESVLQFDDYTNICNCNNFENFCKFALDSIEESCMHTTEYTTGFYNVDCVFKNLSYELKSWMFISEYPLFIEVGNSIVNCPEANVSMVVKNAIRRYYWIVEKFSKYGIITQIYDNYILNFICN